MSQTIECGRCHGSGTMDARCPSCDGTGTEYGLETGDQCAVCGGSGREPVLCWHCDGQGQVDLGEAGSAGEGSESSDGYGLGW